MTPSATPRLRGAWAALPALAVGLAALQMLPVLLTLGALGVVGLWLGTGAVLVVLPATSRHGETARGRGRGLAVAMLFLVGQLVYPGVADTAGSEPLSVHLWTAGSLVVLALAGLATRAVRLAPWDRWDSLAIGLALAAGAWGVAGPLVADLPVAWGAAGRSGMAAGLWLAASRCLEGAPPATGRWLSRGLLAILVVGALVGGARVGILVASERRGQALCQAGEPEHARVSLERAESLAASLQLTGHHREITLTLASIRAAQGDTASAAQILGLRPDLSMTLGADTWSGPVGRHLDYQVACWTDVALYPGQVQIRIEASGAPYLNLWPLMRVHLGGRAIGEASVISATPALYDFWATIDEGGPRRLTVELLNDTRDPADNFPRKLEIGRVEVRYQKVAWDR